MAVCPFLVFSVVFCTGVMYRFCVLSPSSLFRPKPGSSTILTSPYFPMDILKTLMMGLLSEAVQKGAAHIRDPIGGTNATLFVYVFVFKTSLFQIHSFREIYRVFMKPQMNCYDYEIIVQEVTFIEFNFVAVY